MTDNVNNTDINIAIDLDHENDIIVLHFKTDDRHITIGFSIQEAQLLGLMLGESVSTMLLNKMQLSPSTPENVH